MTLKVPTQRIDAHPLLVII